MVIHPSASALEAIDGARIPEHYHLWAATAGELLRRLGADEEARLYFQRALEMAPTNAEREFSMMPLALSSGRTIESTQLRGVLLGVEYHGWSRNRGPGAPWNPTTDNVVTQLALVDAALAKEVGE